METQFDTIIIGSGIGGLTTAVLLSKVFNKKVLVLEKHFVPGGQTHDFVRTHNGQKFSWDVGIHYIGDLKKGHFGRKIFDFITNNQLNWQKMPHVFEKFVYPDFTFEQPSNPKEFADKLIGMFPSEKDAVQQYFIDIKNAAKWYQSQVADKLMPRMLSRIKNVFSKDYSDLALQTTQTYLDKHFEDEKLKAILTSVWGDYGVPPKHSAFLMHSLVIKSYLYGGYYPIGGAGKIAKSMIPIIEENGGKVMTNISVEEIIIKDNKAVGVKTKKGKNEAIFSAETIISDAGAYNTYLKLIPQEIDIPFKEEIKNAMGSLSSITLHVGFKESPEKLGVKGENYWIFNEYDHNKSYEKSMNNLNIHSAFVSFPSLKDRDVQDHTAEIITFTNYDLFVKWQDSTWLKRDEDYKLLKEKLSQQLLDYTDKQLPGFKDIVAFTDLATPLTMEFFTNWKKGSFYGIPATPERFKYKWISPDTPIKNLYLTGTDAATLGVFGALMGGIFTTAKVVGTRGMMRMMKAIG